MIDRSDKNAIHDGEYSVEVSLFDPNQKLKLPAKNVINIARSLKCLTEIRYFINLINQENLFIDIGAGSDLLSIFIAKQFPRKRIISLNDSLENLNDITAAINLNGINNIQTYHTTSFHSIDFGRLIKQENRIAKRSNESKSKQQKEINSKEKEPKNASPFTKNPIVIRINHSVPLNEVLKIISQFVNSREPVRFFIKLTNRKIKIGCNEWKDFLNGLMEIGFQPFEMNNRKGVIRKIDFGNLRNCQKSSCGINNDDEPDYLICVPVEQALSVIFFSHEPFLAGAERSLLEICSELVKQGIICSVIVPQENALARELRKVGAIVIIHEYNWWTNDLYFRKEYLRIKDILLPQLRVLNADIYFTNTAVIPWGAISAVLNRKPHVWYIREFGDKDHNLQFPYPVIKMGEIIRDSSNLVFTNSLAVKDYYYGPIKNEKVRNLYPQQNLIKDAMHQVDLHKSPLTLSMLGTVHEGKGQMDAILAVSELKRSGSLVNLNIVGMANNKYLELLEDIVQTEGLNSQINFLDFVEDPQKIYRESDIILVCSRNEAFGRVVTEAMSYGIPVIATRSGGIPEIINDNESGLLYDPGNYHQLADKIRSLIVFPNLRKKISQNALIRVKAFTLSNNDDHPITKDLFSLKSNKNETRFKIFRMLVCGGVVGKKWKRPLRYFKVLLDYLASKYRDF